MRSVYAHGHTRRQDAGAPDAGGACFRFTSRQDAGAPGMIA
jgi:hypothetical protein